MYTCLGKLILGKSLKTAYNQKFPGTAFLKKKKRSNYFPKLSCHLFLQICGESELCMPKARFNSIQVS